jgi:hypothetical protein
MNVRDLIFGQLTNRCTLNNVESKTSDIAKGNGLHLNPNANSAEVGTILFEEYPIGTTAIAFFDDEEGFCKNCIIPLTNRVSCPNNCGDDYCSKNCFDRANNLYHKILCTTCNPEFLEYTLIARSSSNEYYIVAARLLALFPNAPWLFHYHCPDWTELDHFSSPRALNSETEKMALLLRNGFKRFLSQEDCEKITTDILSRTIGMLRVNVLALRSGESIVGFAMYATQSLMNHSTQPNCRCVSMSSGSESNISCLCGIEAIKRIQPGDELFIDYVAGMKNESALRSSTLRLQYGINETHRK